MAQTNAPSIILPLVALSSRSETGTVRGEPHMVWGLNWGVGRNMRNRNEAAIAIPQAAWRASPDFFPRGTSGNRVQFRVFTDDGASMDMTVVEQNDKALHSVPTNDLLGLYFRRRLGVADGSVVTLGHLRAFGSRFVRFSLLDDDSYVMEYSPAVEAQGTAFYGLAPM